MKISSALWVLALSCSSLAFAASEPVVQLGGRSGAASPIHSLDDDYRLGDEWGKKPVSNESLKDPLFARAARATAKVGGGTGFYLGVYAGQHVVGTNHHVCPSVSSCVGSNVNFTLLSRKFRVTRSLGTWPEIDFSLLLIEVTRPEDVTLLSQVAADFDFESPIRPGQPLLTVGFGTADNWMRAMVANQDSDCKVFSGVNEFRLMGDPDAYNPGPYKAWSFANGCDVSHGDSGSAMVDRNTGRPIGIIWTGKIPKSQQVRSSSYLDQLLRSPTEEVWTELSYAVPAAKMKEFFERLLAQGNVPAADAAVLEDVIH